MKNKKLILTSGILLALAVIVSWLFWPVVPSPKSVATNIKPVQPAIDPALKPFLPEIEAIKRLAKTEPKKAREKSSALLEKLPDKYKRYFTLGFSMGMSSIDFYGQIVDQYDEPVAKASVGFFTGGAGLASGKGIGKVNADEQGRFEIHSEGGSLVLTGIRAPGINFSYPVPTHLKYTPFGARIATMRFTGYQHVKGGNTPLWRDTSPDKPYVFTAWRVEKYEDVKVGNQNGYYISDGRVYTLNFDGRKIHERIIEGVSDGYLQISCVHAPMKNGRDPVDWQITISPIDGGIQATNDLYLNWAPEAGYQPSLTIDMRQGSPNYQISLKNQRYFFTAKNGQVYGSLYLHMEAYGSENECRVNISQYKINTNGSRNLAIKPKH